MSRVVVHSCLAASLLATFALLAVFGLSAGSVLAEEPVSATQPAAAADAAEKPEADKAAPAGGAADHNHAEPNHAPAAGGHGEAAHGAAHGADAHHGDGHHEEHESGLPMNFKADLALWSLVTFLLFVFILGKFAWGPLAKALDAREAGIRKDIADAEAHRVKSEQLLKEYEAKLAQSQEEVKAIIAEARRDAEHTKQDIMATAQRESEATRQRAITEIERAKDAALDELFDFTSKNVLQATELMLQRSLSGDDHDRLVREALSQIDVRKN